MGAEASAVKKGPSEPTFSILTSALGVNALTDMTSLIASAAYTGPPSYTPLPSSPPAFIYGWSKFGETDWVKSPPIISDKVWPKLVVGFILAIMILATVLPAIYKDKAMALAGLITYFVLITAVAFLFSWQLKDVDSNSYIKTYLKQLSLGLILLALYFQY